MPSIVKPSEIKRNNILSKRSPSPINRKSLSKSPQPLNRREEQHASSQKLGKSKTPSPQSSDDEDGDDEEEEEDDDDENEEDEDEDEEEEGSDEDDELPDFESSGVSSCPENCNGHRHHFQNQRKTKKFPFRFVLKFFFLIFIRYLLNS